MDFDLTIPVEKWNKLHFVERVSYIKGLTAKWNGCGIIVDSLWDQWDHSGITMGSQWDHSRIADHSGITEGSQWDHSGITVGS